MLNGSAGASSWTPTEVERLHNQIDAQTSSLASPVGNDIEDCLNALNGSNQVEVVDGGSSDQTQTANCRFANPRFVGSGSFGIVFFVFDKKLDLEVAIKLLRPSRNSPLVRQRFLEEAKITANLNHSGIIRLFESGTIGAIPYITSAIVPDGSLAELIGQNPNGIEPRRAVEILAQVVEAVAYAHSKLTYHRDIKPGNILLGKTKPEAAVRAVLTDFGLAKRWDKTEAQLTLEGDILGTTRYMSPEQARGDLTEFSVASEVFTLGIILFEMLTGQIPFDGKTNTEIRRSIIQGKIGLSKNRLAGSPKDLIAIVARCLQLAPEDRYESAVQLHKDLHRFLDGQPVEASRPSLMRLVIWKAKQHPVATGLAVFTLLTVVMATIGVSWAYWKQYQASSREYETKIEYVRLFGKLIDEVVAGEKNQQTAILESLDAFQGSLARDLSQNSNDQSLLHLRSLIHHYQSIVSQRDGNYAQAAERRIESISVLHELKSRYPQNSKYRFQYIYGIIALCELHSHAQPAMLEKLPPRIDLSNPASLANWVVEEIDQLLIDFPSIPEFQDAANAFRLEMAKVLYGNDPGRSDQLVASAINDSIELANQYPHSLTYIKPAISGYRHLAGLAVDAKQIQEAIRQLAKARECFDKYLCKENNLPWVHATSILIQADRVECLRENHEYDAATLEANDCVHSCQELYKHLSYDEFAVSHQFRCLCVRYQIATQQGASTEEISSDLESCAYLARKKENSRTFCSAQSQKCLLPAKIQQILEK